MENRSTWEISLGTSEGARKVQPMFTTVTDFIVDASIWASLHFFLTGTPDFQQTNSIKRRKGLKGKRATAADGSVIMN